MMKIDRSSQTWRVIEAWARDRIETRTRTCTTPGTPLDQTEQARGAISDLELLLDLAREPGDETIKARSATDF